MQRETAAQNQQEKTADKDEEARLRFINKPWRGNLDGMLERGLVRVLIAHPKIRYFTMEGKPKGIAYELLTHFQDWENKKHSPGIKHVKTYVAFVAIRLPRLLGYRYLP